MNGAQRIEMERARQVVLWGDEHDDDHLGCEMIQAACTYAGHAFGQVNVGCREGDPNDDEPVAWPWDRADWHPAPNPIRNLEKAGALIAAEIDRLLRLREQTALDVADKYEAPWER